MSNTCVQRQMHLDTSGGCGNYFFNLYTCRNVSLFGGLVEVIGGKWYDPFEMWLKTTAIKDGHGREDGWWIRRIEGVERKVMMKMSWRCYLRRREREREMDDEGGGGRGRGECVPVVLFVIWRNRIKIKWNLWSCIVQPVPMREAIDQCYVCSRRSHL